MKDSCIIYVEFEFIHPFADCNRRMGRLWQTLILSKWNPIFLNIPLESLIYQNQKSYYDALQASIDRSDSAPFIEFILQMILDAILSSDASAQDTAQVKRFIQNMEQKEYSLTELMRHCCK